MTDLPPDDQKEIIKQAIKEWLDDRVKDFGWWFIQKLAIAAFASFLFWYITYRGYKFP